VQLSPHTAQAGSALSPAAHLWYFPRWLRSLARASVSLFPAVQGVCQVQSAPTRPTSAPFRVRHRPIQPVMSSRCLSAAGFRFPGLPLPLGGSPSLRLAYCSTSRPRRGSHVPHGRDATGVGACTTGVRHGVPGGRVPPFGRRSGIGCRSPTSACQPLSPTVTGLNAGSLEFTRPVFPWPGFPWRLSTSLGVHPRLGPAGYPARPEGVETGLDTGLEALASLFRATSCRTR
jgi:hypothetical protein